jgi:hypothetical protein
MSHEEYRKMKWDKKQLSKKRKEEREEKKLALRREKEGMTNVYNC